MQLRTAVSLVLLALALALPSCGGGDEKPGKGEAASKGEQSPQGKSDQNEKTYESMVSLMEKLADIADANRDDCDAMALAMDGLLQSQAKLLKRARSVRKASGDDRGLQEKFQPRLMAAMDKLVEPMKHCKGNEALQRAVETLAK